MTFLGGAVFGMGLSRLAQPYPSFPVLAATLLGDAMGVIGLLLIWITT